MKYDSIGFDLDGTLWNPLEAITEAWIITADKYNLPRITKEDMAGALGLNKIDLMNKLYPELDSETQMKFFEDGVVTCDKILSEKGGMLFDGLEETLSELKKHFKLYIVSNCQDGYIETFLRFHKLEGYFCDSEHPDARCLPKGENLKTLLERNGFKNSIFVGDTQGDADAAKFADLPFIFASFGFGNVETPDYTINTFPEILNIVM